MAKDTITTPMLLRSGNCLPGSHGTRPNQMKLRSGKKLLPLLPRRRRPAVGKPRKKNKEPKHSEPKLSAGEYAPCNHSSVDRAPPDFDLWARLGYEITVEELPLKNCRCAIEKGITSVTNYTFRDVAKQRLYLDPPGSIRVGGRPPIMVNFKKRNLKTEIEEKEKVKTEIEEEEKVVGGRPAIMGNFKERNLKTEIEEKEKVVSGCPAIMVNFKERNLKTEIEEKEKV